MFHLPSLEKTNKSQADAEQRPMYLESSTEHNNGYYAKFGFEVKCDVVFEGGPEPITMWIMVREPQKTRPACSSVIVSAVSSAVKF